MPDAAPAPTPPGRFRLMRFFMLTTVLLFAGAGVAVVLLQHREEEFFARAQQHQRQFLARSQAELAQRTKQAAQASLLAVHEAAHVNLARLVANTMWERDFAPVVQAAQRLPVAPCRKLSAPDGLALAALHHGCHAALGQRIMALPGFEALDRKAYAAMRSTSVFKMKVFDLRGITVYSSEHSQVGEDGSENLGWRSAVAGTPASELTHRERFSAFERVVEDRDLISSYVPVRAAPDGPVVGVVELYSDVTPFLAQTRAANERFARNIADNEAESLRTSAAMEREVTANSSEFIVVVGGLLALLYGASIFVVRIGQRIIDRQTLAQQQAAEREQLWQREKMAALGAMAANVAHEVCNPLAVISGLAQELREAPPTQQAAAQQILAQTERIATMVRRIADFASTSGDGQVEAIDLNALVSAVCEFQAFDGRFRRKPIRFEPGRGLPACRAVPDQLREALMNLLQACADVSDSQGQERTINLTTALQAGGQELRVALTCRCAANGSRLAVDYVAGDPRFARAREQVQQGGGRVELRDQQLLLVLPVQT